MGDTKWTLGKSTEHASAPDLAAGADRGDWANWVPFGSVEVAGGVGLDPERSFCPGGHKDPKRRIPNPRLKIFNTTEVQIMEP